MFLRLATNSAMKKKISICFVTFYALVKWMDCAFSFSDKSIILCRGAYITRGVNKKRVQKTIAAPIAIVYNIIVNLQTLCYPAAIHRQKVNFEFWITYIFRRSFMFSLDLSQKRFPLWTHFQTFSVLFYFLRLKKKFFFFIL